MIGGARVFRFQVTPFVILFVERAGSTFLITALKSHPEVQALTEKFDAMRKEGKGAAEQLEWASAFLTPPFVGTHRAIGFKTKLVDVLDRDGFARLITERKCHVIQMLRRNPVKAVVSTLNARRQWNLSGNWNRLSDNAKLPPFEVDPAEFARLLHEREELDRDVEGYVSALQRPTLRLFYEDLLQDEHAFVSKTLDFLNCTDQPLTSLTLKNTNDDLREAVVNFDDLRAGYAGTRYESMFDEVMIPA
jgi:LPS sulfotransferase NodH